LPGSRLHICLVNASGRAFGAERSLAGLVAAADRARFRFSLVAPDGDAADLFREAGVERVVHLPFRILNRKGGLFRRTLQIVPWIVNTTRALKAFRHLRPDVIHANGIQAVLQVGLAARLMGIPLIWHVRDLGRPRWAKRFSAWCAQIALAPSAAAAREVDGLGLPVYEVANPIQISSGVEHTAQGKTDNRPVSLQIGVIGQLIPRKGQDLLLRALPRIVEKVPHVSVQFVGDSPDPDSAYVRDLREQVEASPELRRRVTFCGYVRDMEEGYRSLDLLVVPSREEAFGRTALEAMVYGVPVIAARTGGLMETIQNGVNGLLFEPGSWESLAEKVIHLAGNPSLRTELIQEGFRTLLHYQSRVKTDCERIQRLYSLLVSQKNSPSVRRPGEKAIKQQKA